MNEVSKYASIRRSVNHPRRFGGKQKGLAGWLDINQSLQFLQLNSLIASHPSLPFLDRHKHRRVLAPDGISDTAVLQDDQQPLPFPLRGPGAHVFGCPEGRY